jgi:hypothetical protein
MSTLNIGVVPKGWNGNADGGSTIEIGNPAFSMTRELTIAFGERGTGTLDGDTPVKFRSVSSLGKDSSADLKVLVAAVSERLKVKVSPKSLATAVRVVAEGSDEWEDDDSIEFVTEDGPEIASGEDYAGTIFVHYFDIDAECDRVIVLRGR